MQIPTEAFIALRGLSEAEAARVRRFNGTWVARLWSATVFFERYMATGSAGTRKEFGPKKASRIASVERR